MREGFAERDHLGVVGPDFDAESTLAHGVEECGGYDVGGDACAEVLADEACFCEDDGCEGAIGGIEFGQTCGPVAYPILKFTLRREGGLWRERTSVYTLLQLYI